MWSRTRRPAALPGWAAPAAVGVLTVLGVAIRAANLNQGLFGDELSTAWIVHGRSLPHVIRLVYSDAEVTPPLSFVLAWISLKIGSSWAWLRAPSLIAGGVTIPIVYATGVRVAGRAAGLIAAAIVTLSAVMIVYSDEARNYAVMMACVAGSTLALLLALDTRRARWWTLYGIASCLAMYSHYTAAFVLAVQAVWVLWRHPEARRPVLLANLGAAVLYAPWIPGWIRDTHSVTIPIIDALLPLNLHFVARSVAEWAAGYPYVSIHQAPGVAWALCILAAVLVALLGVALRVGRLYGAWLHRVQALFSARTGLLLLLAVATFAGELIVSILGTHVLDSRDLNASWPAMAVSIGALVAAAPALPRAVSCALLLAGYGAGAVDTLQTRWQRPDYPAAAQFISSHARPGDVVIDESNVPVVPLTGLEAFLGRRERVFTVGLPEGPPPYTLASRVPSPTGLTRQAIAQASSRGRIFLVNGSFGGHAELAALAQRFHPGQGGLLPLLPAGSRVEEVRRFPGLETLTVSMIAIPSPAGAPRQRR